MTVLGLFSSQLNKSDSAISICFSSHLPPLQWVTLPEPHYPAHLDKEILPQDTREQQNSCRMNPRIFSLPHCRISWAFGSLLVPVNSITLNRWESRTEPWDGVPCPACGGGRGRDGSLAGQKERLGTAEPAERTNKRAVSHQSTLRFSTFTTSC